MNKILEGMILIAKYEPDADCSAEHDQIWFGKFQPDLMTEEEFKLIDELGWFSDEGSWTHFV